MSSKLGGQALVLDVEGTWRELTGVVNKLAANLTNQVRSIARVTKAVALGDLSKQIDVDARGEILELKNTVNGMVVRLRALAAEVTRVTLEVGFKGKLGGQAHVPDVEGVWLELTRNVSLRFRITSDGGRRSHDASCMHAWRRHLNKASICRASGIIVITRLTRLPEMATDNGFLL